MIFVSTGGFPDLPGWKSAAQLVDNGIKNVELSGGKFSAKNLHELKQIKRCSNVEFQVHNYFPPPPIPFVLNLVDW